MIDEKRLDELKSGILRGGHTSTMGELLEVYRLARLGLWAEKHGVPALEVTRGQWIHSVNATQCLEAIAALPKEGQ